MATLADLTASTRRTTGQRPPPLVHQLYLPSFDARSRGEQVGASTTVVGCKLFLFGGRLVPTRTMVNTLYVLDLESLVWEQLWPPADRAVRVASNEGQEGMEELEDGEAVKDAPLRGPQARYFHSCDVHGDLLLIFGGVRRLPLFMDPSLNRPTAQMGYQHAPSRPESPAGSVSSRNSGRSRQSKSPQQDAADPGLCVLADLIIYDTVKNTWSFPSPPVVSTTAGSPNTSPHSATMPLGPSPRYAHLSCISNSCLVILGGQDLANRYLQEISVLDLERMVWVETRRYDGAFF